MRAALLLVAVLSGCCSHDIAARHALISLEVNRAHEADEELPEKAREIAKDNAEAWAVQAYILEGSDD